MKYFPLFLLFTLCNAELYEFCDNYKSLDTCINNPLCQWCNTTINGTCSSNTQCFYNNTQCITNYDFNVMCSLLNIFFISSLLFILFGSIAYISYFTKTLLDKYFYTPNNDGLKDRRKIKLLILTIVNILLFSPLIIFWIIGSIGFIYYYIFIMFMIILLSCTVTTKKIYKSNKSNKSAYIQIN